MLSPADQTLAILAIALYSDIAILGLILLFARGVAKWHTLGMPILTLCAFRIAINTVHLIERDVEEEERHLPAAMREMVPLTLLLLAVVSMQEKIHEMLQRMTSLKMFLVIRALVMVIAVLVGAGIITQQTCDGNAFIWLFDAGLTCSIVVAALCSWLAVDTFKLAVNEESASSEVVMAITALFGTPAVAVKLTSILAMRCMPSEMMTAAQTRFFINVYGEGFLLLAYVCVALYSAPIAQAWHRYGCKQASWEFERVGYEPINPKHSNVIDEKKELV